MKMSKADLEDRDVFVVSRAILAVPFFAGVAFIASVVAGLAWWF